MTRRTGMLLTATATVALLGMAAPGAFAFDKVDWRWEKHVDEWVNIDIDITTDVYPDGLVEVEKLQAHFGKVEAKAEVKYIYNNVDQYLYDDLKAKDLPKIENTATAVANNQSITADVPIYLHDAQFAAGDLGRECMYDYERCLYVQWDGGEYGNTHTDIAGLLTLGALLNVVDKGEVKAEAYVSDILNAFVENSATAVANNASFTIESDNLDNHVLIADLTQWSYNNVKADAKVENITLAGYEDFYGSCFGTCDEEIVPIISNTATAVGNNLSINVGVPTPSEL